MLSHLTSVAYVKHHVKSCTQMNLNPNPYSIRVNIMYGQMVVIHTLKSVSLQTEAANTLRIRVFFTSYFRLFKAYDSYATGVFVHGL